MSILETTYKNLEDDFDSYKDLLRQSEFDLKVLYGKQEDHEGNIISHEDSST